MRLSLLLAFAFSAPLLYGCAVLTPLPERTALDERLKVFPTAGLPLRAPATIWWNEHQVPFIEAATDDDLAFLLGMVHAHLRLGQMTVLRRVAQGRIAESVGPLAADIDHSLRILNFGRGAAEFEKSMPAETRAFTENFVRGINHYQDRLAELPHEFKVLGLTREPWTVRDVWKVGRLAGTDVNWLGYFSLLRLRDRPDWPEIWARLLKHGGESAKSFAAADGDARRLADLLAGASRTGSNAIVVAGRKSASGAALMASDPHLGIQMPNLWLLAGFKSPGHHAVGMMIPGVPFVALGRNPHIAWGGTNMRAASSDLYDLAKQPPGSIESRRETIKIRWWPSREIVVRESKFGPVLSDAPVLNWKGAPFALRWIGHERGDEITAMLRAQRARNFKEYRAAFEGFAVSAQNMLYADTAGNIGQVMATILPIRARRLPPDIILDPTDPQSLWKGVATAAQLPASYNPAAGFLASANNRPTETPFPVGYVYSADDRVLRMAELAKAKPKLSLADMKALQQDVYVRSAVALRDAYVGAIRRTGAAEGLPAAAQEALKLMEAWDGHYRAEAREPVAFELFHHHFQSRYYERRYGKEAAGTIVNLAAMPPLLLEDIKAQPDAALKPAVREALAEAGRKLDRHRNWGEMHRLGLAHPLAFVPVLGGRYRFGDFPAAGSSESLMKTAHSSTDERHFTRYGQQSRFVADLGDPDANEFVLLGGQDGWISSSTALDQIPLWRAGGYIRLPLRVETVRAGFARRMALQPAPPR